MALEEVAPGAGADGAVATGCAGSEAGTVGAATGCGFAVGAGALSFSAAKAVKFSSAHTTKGKTKHVIHADSQNFIESKVGPEGFALKGKSARCARREGAYGRAP